MRPAHLHFLIFKPGYKTQFSQVYSSDDPHLDTDVQFGVTETLIARYERHREEPVPYGEPCDTWSSLECRFAIEPGAAKLPRPPITGKVR
jgi:catechol 1,2-dioxygenase